jgi:lipopolysaccharide/colanic/teichoic acid biosynthesis glycosyltransferase
MEKAQVLRQGAELIASAGCMALAAFAYAQVDPNWAYIPGLGLGMALASVLFWAVAQTYDPEHVGGAWARSLEMTCAATGASLILEAILAWSSFLEPVPIPVALAAGFLSGLSITILRARPFRVRPQVFMGGCDGIAAELAAILGPSLIGTLAPDTSQAQSGFPFRGALSRSSKPAKIVVSEDRIPPRFLLAARWSGIAVDEPVTMYTRLFQRVPVEALTPLQLLRAPTLSASRPMMAVQAIYSNLAGLSLLIALSPLLALVAVISRLAAGSGPLFEHIPSTGLEEVSFDRLRFRTRRSSDGAKTWIGGLILRLRMENLPQLINLVRGEMASFGPPAVRAEFFRRLRELMPLAAIRVTQRPGLLGWSQVHRRPGERLQEETLCLGYDLYYMQESSPSLDFEILLRWLWRIVLPARWRD